MTIITKRLKMRPVCEADWQAIQHIWEDFNHSEYAQYDTPHNTDPEDVQQRIARWSQASAPTHMFFAVCLKDTVSGYISLHQRERGHEMGICFHSDYAGYGYAKESVLALIDYVKSLGIDRLLVGTAENNLPSNRLLRALDFKKTGSESVSFYKDSTGNPIWFEGGDF